MLDERAVIRANGAVMPVLTCLLSAAACILLLAGGSVAAGHNDALLIPLGSMGGALWGAYWLSVVIWLVGAVLAARCGRWLVVLGSVAPVLLTLLPSGFLLAACAQGNCI